jgi:hypothetical protein
VIEPTDEMVSAYIAGQDAGDGSIEDGLAAVLVLIERDLGLRAPLPTLTCGAAGPDGPCERAPHVASQRHGRVGSGGLSMW